MPANPALHRPGRRYDKFSEKPGYTLQDGIRERIIGSLRIVAPREQGQSAEPVPSTYLGVIRPEKCRAMLPDLKVNLGIG